MNFNVLKLRKNSHLGRSAKELVLYFILLAIRYSNCY